eukprot:6133905-Ditylum_brightwellii.AAC.1
MDFTCEEHFVARGHTTEALVCLTYSSVVSRESKRLIFLIANLNHLNIKTCDIGNTYLNTECREQIWFEGGQECGEVTNKEKSSEKGWDTALGGAEEPKKILGANIERFQLQDGQVVWNMSSNQYIANAVRTVEDMLETDNRKLNEFKKRNTPLPY